MNSALLEMHGIVKNYGAVRANRGVDFVVAEKRVVGLLGENGSGKSTLMKVLFGMIKPDGGSVVFQGQTLFADQAEKQYTPRAAMAAGIGMIHQHFTLVEAMTVTENIMLGWGLAARHLSSAAVAAKIEDASREYGLAVDPRDVVADLSFGQRQRVEIVKAILGGNKLLILDEPTSNLSPPEVSGLLNVIRLLKEQGHSIVFISHKLAEVLEICDEVVVLRDGAVSGRMQIADATRQSLARMMVERDLQAPIHRHEQTSGADLFVVTGLCSQVRQAGPPLRDIRFTIRAGEILAIAGVDGNGQKELLDSLAGISPTPHGRVYLNGVDITRMNARQRLEAGLAYIPVDRSRTSLVPGFTIAENLAMRDITRRPIARGPFPHECGPCERSRVRAWRRSTFARPTPTSLPVRYRAAISKRLCWRGRLGVSRKCCSRFSRRGGSIQAPRVLCWTRSDYCATREPRSSTFPPNSKRC